MTPFLPPFHRGKKGEKYREELADLLEDEKWRDTMAKEIKDARRVAREINDPKKYNEAMQEMLAYFKCLEKHGLLTNRNDGRITLVKSKII